jgi:hypothetical protein
MSFKDQLIKVGQSSKYGINVSIVFNIIAEIDHRRLIHRAQPNCADVEIAEVVKPRYNTYTSHNTSQFATTANAIGQESGRCLPSQSDIMHVKHTRIADLMHFSTISLEDLSFSLDP